MSFRFSLRTLFISVAFLCIALSIVGTFVGKRMRLKAYADQLRRNGAEVYLDSEGETQIWGGNNFQNVLSCHFMPYWQPESTLLPKIASVEFVETEIRPTVTQLLRLAAPIERLAFNHCKIGKREWQDIQSIRDIRFLSLSNCRVETLESLRRHNIRTIKFLSLENAGVSVEILESLRDFPNLEVLDLSSNPIGDEVIPVLTSMPRLRMVALDDTGVGDETLRALATIKEIEHVSVYDTKVSMQQIAEIKSTSNIHIGHESVFKPL